MKNATFYLLDNDAAVDGLSAVEQLVCEIAAERWRSWAAPLSSPVKMKSRLTGWIKPCGRIPAESFVPHNLAEQAGQAVRQCGNSRSEKRSSSPRDILISLRTSFADFATAFTEVVDFVPL
ncbi:DNA polymerase III subunit chi [Escherichia coli]